MKPSTCTHAHTSHHKVSEDVPYENKLKGGKKPQSASQAPHEEDAQNCILILHSLHDVSCVPEKQATDVNTTSKA